MAERDPRTDPRVGDVLEDKNEVRTVEEVWANGDVDYWTDSWKWPSRGFKSATGVAWQTWARDAQIIEQAKEQNDVEA
jgi:hypothetical protein